MPNPNTPIGFKGLDSLKIDVSKDIQGARDAISRSRTQATSQLKAASKPAQSTAPPLAPSARKGGDRVEPEQMNLGYTGWAVGAVMLLVSVGFIASMVNQPANVRPQSAQAHPSPGASSRLSESKPPVGRGQVLSSEVRYCLAEEIRIEAMRPLATADPGLSTFNQYVDDYNARCSNAGYRGSIDSLRREVRAYKGQLEAEGRARLSATQHSGGPGPLAGTGDGFVIVDVANVRAGTSTSDRITAKLTAMTRVRVTERLGDWMLIAFKESDGAERTGYVHGSLVFMGSELGARERYCQDPNQVRPATGAVLAQAGIGSNVIDVTAGSTDTVVKLKAQQGWTALQFYIRAGETARISSVRDGTYKVLFASGSDYSSKCGEFLSNMVVFADADPVTLATTHDGEYVYSSTLSYRLTATGGGNFRPTTVSAADFRDAPQ